MKTCKKCWEEKPHAEFNKSSRRSDGLQIYCRACQKQTHKDYYAENKTGRQEQIRARSQEMRELNQSWAIEYLKQHPCVDCGNDDIRVLEFDHVRDTKKYNVGVLIGQGYAMTTLLAEVAKCEIRCANCHAIVTAQRAGWGHRYLSGA